MNLFWCGKLAKKRICEIGFNAGHSCMLFLLGRDNSPLEFTIFDIGGPRYTRPCLEYIKHKFLHVDFEYIEGNSIITVPEWMKQHPELIGTYDVVHVDGGHAENCIFNDMRNTDILVKVNGIIIIDDTDASPINKFVDLYISTGNYIELDILRTFASSHRIIQKIK
jgi:hypothetical protein